MLTAQLYEDESGQVFKMELHVRNTPCSEICMFDVYILFIIIIIHVIIIMMTLF